jgi:hypothetical protein
MHTVDHTMAGVPSGNPGVRASSATVDRAHCQVDLPMLNMSHDIPFAHGGGSLSPRIEPVNCPPNAELTRVQPPDNMRTLVNDSPTAVGDQSLAYHLSGKEILSSIQPFSGNVDRTASVLDNDTFIDFHDWFDASVWRLTVA